MSHQPQGRTAPPPLSDLTGRQVQWIGAGYLMALSSMAGQTIFIAQFNAAIRETFGLSHGEFGGLYTLATLASSAVLIWAGGFADRVAPRWLAAICLCILAAVGVSMASAQNVIWLGITIFGLRLFGQGMMSHIAMTTMSRWFNRFRGRALALAQLGMPTGDALVPFFVTIIIAQIGWRQTWLLTVGIILLLLLPAIVFLLRDPPDGKRAKAAGYVNPDADTGSLELGAKWTRGAVARDRLFWMTIPGLMGPPAIGTLFLFHQAHMTELKGWDLTLFTAQFPILAITVVVSAMIAGSLIDRFGATRLLPFVLVPLGIASLLIGLFEPAWVIPLFFFFAGMTTGLMSPTAGALWVELYGTKHIGAIRALAASAFVFGSAVGPGLAGYLIDWGVELDIQAFFYATFCFAASLIYLLTAPTFANRVADISAERLAKLPD